MPRDRRRAVGDRHALRPSARWTPASPRCATSAARAARCSTCARAFELGHGHRRPHRRLRPADHHHRRPYLVSRRRGGRRRRRAPQGARDVQARRRLHQGDGDRRRHASAPCPGCPPTAAAELAALADEAHRQGRTITAHCLCAEATDWVVDAGFDGIEHAGFLVERVRPPGLRAGDGRARSRAPASPAPARSRSAASCCARCRRWSAARRRSEAALDRWLRMFDENLAQFRRMREAGVTWVAGTDAGWRYTTIEGMPLELELMQQGGMPALEAITAGTGLAARVSRLEQTVGTLQPGMIADVLVVARQSARRPGPARRRADGDAGRRGPGPASGMTALLEVEGLQTHFRTRAGMVRAVDGISFALEPGGSLGIVGESGSGKTVTSLSIMRLLEPPGFIAGGRILFRGRDMVGLSEREIRDIRGAPALPRVPGPDDGAQPGLPGRRAGRRSAAGACRDRPAVGNGAHRRAVPPARHPGAGAARARIPASAQRRHAPARDDRHGAGQRAGAADPRRADHGARRDHPGADPRPDPRLAAAGEHGGAADHPRYRRGRGALRARAGDVWRPGHGAGNGGPGDRRSEASLHARAARLDPDPGQARDAGWTRSAARCPTRCACRRAARSSRAAPHAMPQCAADPGLRDPGDGRRVACWLY